MSRGPWKRKESGQPAEREPETNWYRSYFGGYERYDDPVYPEDSEWEWVNRAYLVEKDGKRLPRDERIPALDDNRKFNQKEIAPDCNLFVVASRAAAFGSSIRTFTKVLSAWPVLASHELVFAHTKGEFGEGKIIRGTERTIFPSHVNSDDAAGKMWEEKNRLKRLENPKLMKPSITNTSSGSSKK